MINKDRAKPPNRVNASHVILDKHVFTSFLGNIETLDRDTLVKMIRAHIATRESGPLTTGSQINEFTSSKQVVLTDQDKNKSIHVGHFRDDPGVPLHAYLQYKHGSLAKQPVVAIFRHRHIDGWGAGFAGGNQLKLADASLIEKFKKETLEESKDAIRAAHQELHGTPKLEGRSLKSRSPN